MTSSSRRRAAWAVPAAVAAVVVGASVLPGSASATDHPQLPTLTPAALLAAVGSSDIQALSGTVVQTARLGLPDLPGAGESASFDWQSLITGSHTARVWTDGPERQRLALLGRLSESDVVHSGHDLWTYASDTRKVTHVVLPDGRHEQAAPDATDVTPAAAAEKALAAVDPTTAVTVDPTAVVAERPAYTLVLTPRDARSTVRKVAIAVDSETKVPLRVQVFGDAALPALETGFTDVSFDRPDASVFAFTPPEGATVTTKTLTAPQHEAPSARPARPARAAGPTVVGTGWTSVLVLPSSGTAATTNPLLAQLTTPLPGGDRLLKTALVNALLTTDGRTLVGAVSPEMLQAAAR